MFWSDTAAYEVAGGVLIRRPASMSSWGVTMAFTVLVSLVDKSNVMELVPLAVVMICHLTG